MRSPERKGSGRWAASMVEALSPKRTMTAQDSSSGRGAISVHRRRAVAFRGRCESSSPRLARTQVSADPMSGCGRPRRASGSFLLKAVTTAECNTGVGLRRLRVLVSQSTCRPEQVCSEGGSPVIQTAGEDPRPGGSPPDLGAGRDTKVRARGIGQSGRVIISVVRA